MSKYTNELVDHLNVLAKEPQTRWRDKVAITHALIAGQTLVRLEDLFDRLGDVGSSLDDVASILDGDGFEKFMAKSTELLQKIRENTAPD